VAGGGLVDCVWGMECRGERNAFQPQVFAFST